ncbi:MAG: prepilin-type N-terminal cleavage/methylation domain-containing protein [Verrucomicrobia bacterium]|nr:prepilin-type N-terminal cleavage/methylation domain-containing protein [Verrucomicrobiota bacterium]
MKIGDNIQSPLLMNRWEVGQASRLSGGTLLPSGGWAGVRERRKTGKMPVPQLRRPIRAFTLLEVMIAIFIFFTCIFAILELVSRNVTAARSLTQNVPTVGMLAAELTLTNKLEEGIASGDFGAMYPGYSWMREITLAATNGLFQVDFVVMRQGGYNKNMDSAMSIFLYRPESTMGPGGGGTGLRRTR